MNRTEDEKQATNNICFSIRTRGEVFAGMNFFGEDFAKLVMWN